MILEQQDGILEKPYPQATYQGAGEECWVKEQLDEEGWGQPKATATQGAFLLQA